MHDYTEDQTIAHGERVLIGDQLKQADLQKEGLNQAFLRESEAYFSKLSNRTLKKTAKTKPKKTPVFESSVKVSRSRLSD